MRFVRTLMCNRIYVCGAFFSLCEGSVHGSVSTLFRLADNPNLLTLACDRLPSGRAVSFHRIHFHVGESERSDPGDPGASLRTRTAGTAGSTISRESPTMHLELVAVISFLVTDLSANGHSTGSTSHE